MSIQNLLAKWETHLKAVHPSFWDSLQPGLTDAEIDRQTQDIGPFPHAVRELYRWHNGTEDELIEVLPGMGFYPLERAIEIKHNLRMYATPSQQKTLERHLPLFGDFQGFHVLAVHLGESEPTLERFMASQENLSCAYLDLASMIHVTQECFDAGIYHLDASGDRIGCDDLAAFTGMLQKHSKGLEVRHVEMERPQGLDGAESEDDDLSDDPLLENMMDLLGVSAEDLQPDDFAELLDLYNLSDLPETFQERYRNLQATPAALPEIPKDI